MIHDNREVCSSKVQATFLNRLLNREQLQLHDGIILLGSADKSGPAGDQARRFGLILLDQNVSDPSSRCIRKQLDR